MRRAERAAGGRCELRGVFVPRREEGFNQQRKIFAVATFEKGGGRNGPRFGEPAAEGGKIVALQGHRSDGIARVGIEAGGDENQVGAKRDDGVERGAEGGQVLLARRARGDGPVANLRTEVARAGAGIAGVLVDGGEEEGRAGGQGGGGGRDEVVENGLGAVAVVGIKVPDGDAARGCGGQSGGRKIAGGMNGREGDLVQIAKAHGLRRGGVVTRRTHEGKDGGAVRQGVPRGGECRGYGTAGVVTDVVEKRGVSIEVAGLREAADVGRSVDERKRGIGDRGGGRRQTKLPIRVRCAKVRGGADDAGRLLGT